MYIVNAGGSTSPTDVTAGLMVRVSELSGDRFRAAAGTMNAFLAPAGEAGSAELPDGFDIEYDAVPFYGMALCEGIDVTYGIMLLPFDQVRAFVDEDFGG